MFLAAVAKPGPRYNFDGEVGIWRVAVPYTAKQDSKHRYKGDVYDKNMTMDAELFRKLMTTKVFPAIRKKMHWATSVTLQMEGASPHTGKSNPHQHIKRAGHTVRKGGPKIEVTVQPPQSPETNLNDICFFRSLGKKVQRAQRGASIFDVGRLVNAVNEEWAKYEVDTLNKSWETKKKSCQSNH